MGLLSAIFGKKKKAVDCQWEDSMGFENDAWETDCNSDKRKTNGDFDEDMDIVELYKKTAKNEPAFNQEKMDRILDYLKANWSTPVYRIKAEKVTAAGNDADTASGEHGASLDSISAEKNSSEKSSLKNTSAYSEGLSIFDSKFGGYPYWDYSKEYPKNPKGEPLCLLAQINFETAMLEPANAPEELLPKGGILQFYISCDDSYGLTFRDETVQETFRVIYHPEIDMEITLDDVKQMGIPSCANFDRFDAAFPMCCEMALTFTKDMDIVKVCDTDFEEAIRCAVRDLFGETMEKNAFGHLGYDNFAYLEQNIPNFGNKLLGYPSFTQTDPRIEEPASKTLKNGMVLHPVSEFDTLLFQMDSDNKDIEWGDCGVCNFFIKREDLKKCNFSRVLYNWDCY